MSTFVAIAGKAIHTSRKGIVKVGMDLLGEVSLECDQVYLTAYPAKNTVRVEKRGVLLGSAMVVEGTEIPLESALTLSFKNATVKIWTTPKADEVLARVGLIGADAVLAARSSAHPVSITTKLGVEEVCVPHGIRCRCGTSEQDSIYIETDDMRKAHCELMYLGDFILVRACTGLVSGGSVPVTVRTGYSLDLTPTVRLSI